MNWKFVSSLKELEKHLVSSGFKSPIFFEGCRGSGKTYTAKLLTKRLRGSYYKTGDTFTPVIKNNLTGVARYSKNGMDLTQACIFNLDFIMQTQKQRRWIVFDRSYISSCVFNGIEKEKYETFKTMVFNLNAVFVLMTFDEDIIKQRLLSRKIYPVGQINKLIENVRNEYFTMRNLLQNYNFKNVYVLKTNWND